MSEDFPFYPDLSRQHMDFRLRSPGPEFVTEQAALAEAVTEEWPGQDSPAVVEAWFGDIQLDFPLHGAQSRPRVPANTVHPVWLVRISNILIRKRGRGRSSATSTEEWIIVDGKSGKVLRRFSFR
jgi:hypothetical protein